jgi:hypothetical protein
LRYPSQIAAMCIQTEIREIGTKFQIDNNLDRTEIPSILQRDYIHPEFRALYQ